MPQAQASLKSQVLDFLHRLVANTACWIVYYSFESLLVILVTDESEVGNHILYLLALIERKPTEYTIRESTASESLLKHTRLGVGAVQNGKITEAEPLAAAQLRNFICHNLYLLQIGVCRIEFKRCSIATFRIYILLDLLTVLCYKTIGRIDNHPCRAIILLKLEYLGATVSFGKAQDIANVRTAERVYALGIIAHYAHRLAFLCQLPHNAGLHVVGILELIDKHVTETLYILASYIGKILEQTVCIHEQIIEVHRICKTASFSIPFIYLIYSRNTGFLIIIAQSLVILIIGCRDKIALCR